MRITLDRDKNSIDDEALYVIGSYEPNPDRKGLRLHPPPPQDFNTFTAGMAVLWEQRAARYRDFDHLEPRPDITTATEQAFAVGGTLAPASIESCGYSLSSSPLGINRFHTFVGLGFLDVHVEMTVDSVQNVTSRITAQSVGQINLQVEPGDVISGALCLETKPLGTAHCFLADETRKQTMNFTVDTGFPPAATIDAGVTRGISAGPSTPLAHFGVVHFDEISAFTTSGSRSLTSGQAITMVDHDGSTLARPDRLNESAFKTVFVAA